MEKSTAVNEHALLQSLQKGNTELLEEFYLKGKAEFAKWAEKHFQCRYIEAVDVYQDAIIILYENIVEGNYVQKANASVKTYLYAIGKNIFLKKLNQEKKLSEKVIPELLLEEEEESGSQDLLAEENDQQHDAVMQAFAAMKEPCKSILKYFYYHGLSMKEIADKLGYKSDQVVKSQKVRCLKTLKADALQNLAP